VVSFTLRPLYPRGKELREPLDRRLGGPQRRSGRLGEKKILVPIGSQTPDPLAVQPVASRNTNYSIPAHVIIKNKALILNQTSYEAFDYGSLPQPFIEGK
jgi:hypothetical protein